MPEFLLQRKGIRAPWLYDQLGYANALAFDEWTLRRIPPCDAFIAISGAGLKTGQFVQRRGGKFISDRGSTHIRYRANLLEEEDRRWGISPVTKEDPRDLAREEAIYNAADAITVPSTYARRSFIELGIPAEKIHLLPYGVLLDRFKKVADPPVDAFEVIYVGRISLGKGFPYLLQAFANLRVPKKRLTVIGGVDAAIKPVLEKLPQEAVTFAGMLPQVQLKEWMSRAHVMVMPSLDDGFGMVMNQAMACGCPVIATTNTGAEDLYTHGVEGFIVPIRDSPTITARMQQLADDPALQARMSEAALARVHQLGGWQQYGDGWEHLLQTLTGKADAQSDGSA